MTSTTDNIKIPRVALLVRGHLRCEDILQKEFKELITSLYNQLQVDIYVHTWDRINPGWLGRARDHSCINKETIEKCLHEIVPADCIKNIYVDSEEDVVNKLKSVFKDTDKPRDALPMTRCNKLGWRQYWYATKAGLSSIASSDVEYTHTISTRPDLLSDDLIETSWQIGKRSPPRVITSDDYIDWAIKMIKNNTTNIYMSSEDIYNRPIIGCDNYMIGPTNKLLEVSKWFHDKLEDNDNSWIIEAPEELDVNIYNSKKTGIHQEGLVQYVIKLLGYDQQ